jgi:hypothetical protein
MKRKVLLLALCVFLAGGGFFAYQVYRYVYTTVPNAYAVWWVADMVIEHMEANGGRWPTGWDDLADDYEMCTKRSGRPWTFEDLRSRVKVDWHADPKALSRTRDRGQEKPFRAIWPKDRSSVYWDGREPNRMILDYLKKQKEAPESPDSAPATQPVQMRN